MDSTNQPLLPCRGIVAVPIPCTVADETENKKYISSPCISYAGPVYPLYPRLVKALGRNEIGRGPEEGTEVEKKLENREAVIRVACDCCGVPVVAMRSRMWW
jgi:hypothetical protein